MNPLDVNKPSSFLSFLFSVYHVFPILLLELEFQLKQNDQNLYPVLWYTLTSLNSKATFSLASISELCPWEVNICWWILLRKKRIHYSYVVETCKIFKEFSSTQFFSPNVVIVSLNFDSNTSIKITVAYKIVISVTAVNTFL